MLQMAISYDSLMERLPSPTVIKAVEDSTNGKVVASGADVIRVASMTEGTLDSNGGSQDSSCISIPFCPFHPFSRT